MVLCIFFFIKKSSISINNNVKKIKKINKISNSFLKF